MPASSTTRWSWTSPQLPRTSERRSVLMKSEVRLSSFSLAISIAVTCSRSAAWPSARILSASDVCLRTSSSALAMGSTSCLTACSRFASSASCCWEVSLKRWSAISRNCAELARRTSVLRALNWSCTWAYCSLMSAMRRSASSRTRASRSSARRFATASVRVEDRATATAYAITAPTTSPATAQRISVMPSGYGGPPTRPPARAGRRAPRTPTMIVCFPTFTSSRGSRSAFTTRSWASECSSAGSLCMRKAAAAESSATTGGGCCSALSPERLIGARLGPVVPEPRFQQQPQSARAMAARESVHHRRARGGVDWRADRQAPHRRHDDDGRRLRASGRPWHGDRARGLLSDGGSGHAHWRRLGNRVGARDRAVAPGRASWRAIAPVVRLRDRVPRGGVRGAVGPAQAPVPARHAVPLVRRCLRRLPLPCGVCARQRGRVAGA